MVDFDLECLEMCGKLALEDKDKHETEESSEEEYSETSIGEGEEEEEKEEKKDKKLKPITENKLISRMESLKVDENSKTNLCAKIIELD